MYVIGLAGNIGTGKSTVAGILDGFGATSIDADQVAHHILDNKTVHTELVESFGKEILGYDGKIDRKRLAAIAFSTAEGTARLNEITRPRIKQAVRDELEKLNAEGVRIAVVEAAMMVKGNWTGIIDEMWVTTAPREVIIKRMKNNRGYSEEETEQRLERQMSPQEMLNQADTVINTDFTMEDLKLSLGKLWSELQLRMQSNRDK